MGCCCSLRYRSEEALNIIEQVRNDDPHCRKVEIKPQHCLRKSDIRRLLEGLTWNTHVKRLILGGLRLNDDDGEVLVRALDRDHCAIDLLIVEDNNFSVDAVLRIVQVIVKRKVKWLWIHNQRNWDPRSEAVGQIFRILKESEYKHFVSLDLPENLSEVSSENFSYLRVISDTQRRLRDRRVDRRLVWMNGQSL